jgi:hypothetical protein
MGASSLPLLVGACRFPCSCSGGAAMSLSPHQSRVLREISEYLAISDPWLARQLTGPQEPPTSTARELAVIAVLLLWLALRFVPLGLVVAFSLPVSSESGS